jgi:hypothetical protein
VEAHAADFFEIGHLRNELFLGRQRDQREGSLDVEPAPYCISGRPGFDRQLCQRAAMADSAAMIT